MVKPFLTAGILALGGEEHDREIEPFGPIQRNDTWWSSQDQSIGDGDSRLLGPGSQRRKVLGLFMPIVWLRSTAFTGI